MPIVTKSIDAIYLGNYGATATAPSGALGTWGAPFSGAAREAEVRSISATGNESFANPNQLDSDFTIARSNTGQGINDGDGREQVIYMNYGDVTFQTVDANGNPAGSFTTRMSFLKDANGDLFMFEDSSANSQYSSQIGSREVSSFTINSFSGNRNSIVIQENETFAATFACFVAGTMIMTDKGEVAVETLQQGDLVMTMDHGLQPVRWIGMKRIPAAHLSQHDNKRPIRIRAGALGGGMPQSDLMVSQQHRMLVRSAIAQRMFGEDEVLVAAKHLVLLDGVDIVNDGEDVIYVHFLCSQHEVVFANGAPSETLYTGPEAMKSMSAAARAEILAIFPEVADIDYAALAARTFVNGRKGRQLAVRHKNNKKPLLHLH